MMARINTSTSNQTPHPHIAFSLLKDVRSIPSNTIKRRGLHDEYNNTRNTQTPQMEGFPNMKWIDHGYSFFMNEKELEPKRPSWMSTPQQPSLPPGLLSTPLSRFWAPASFHCRPELFICFPSCFFLLITQTWQTLECSITTSNSKQVLWILVTGILNQHQNKSNDC